MNKIKSFIESKYFILSKTALIHSKYYLKAKRILRKTGNLNKGEIKILQIEQIKKLVTYAYENVEYYRDLFTSADFNPYNFSKIDDIKKIPYLTKDIIRKNPERLISKTFPKKYLKESKTGGSTGTPLSFYLDKRTSSPVEMAYLENMWRRIGYKLYDKCIVMRGEILDNIIEGKKYWKMNFSINWLSMSTFHLTADTFPIYMEKIMNYRPKFIIAYPSVAYVLAYYMKTNNIKPLSSLKAIICSSETLYNWQRKFIQEVCKVRIYSYYGLSEKCCIASECSNSSLYTFYPLYGFTELINNKDEWCTQENEKGEIVATGFNNYASPFIRYRTGDIGLFTKKKCNEANEWFTIKRIEGRMQDYLIDKFQNKITFTNSDVPLMCVKEKINAYQYVQNTKGKVSLNISVISTLSNNEIQDIKRTFHNYYHNFDININIVDNIPVTKSGKFKYLIQNIPNNFQEQ
jgi:phenylacetate-CoA ligase